MMSDSGETSSERGGMMQAALAAAAMNIERSPAQKAVIAHEDESDIILAPQYSNNSGGSSRPPAATVNGRSPRLQGQTGALFKADPLSLSSSGPSHPTTALSIMRRSGGGRSNSNSETTTSGSGGTSLTQDSGVPRSVTAVSPHPTSATPVISNVDIRRGGNNGERRMSGDMPPSSAIDYPPSGVPNWGGSGYAAHPNAHDIHRARWEQEQRELAADYYPSASNYHIDYYNTPGSYYQQQPPPASLRYHHQPHMTSQTSNAATERLAMEHRLQLEQHRMHQDYYTPRVHPQIPPSMAVHPHQAQINHQQQQQQQLQRPGQNESGAMAESKPPSRRSSSPSPGVSSAQRYQVHHQQQRSGSPAIPSIQRNQVHQQMQRSGSPGLSSVQRNHRRNLTQQQHQQSRHAYEERDWRTNQVWREDDHSQTASSLGGLRIPTPPPAAAAAIERGRADNSGAGLQPSSSLHPRSQKQSSQQHRRGSGGMTIDQYDISHAQMYGQSPYVQDLQQLPPHVSATPSPPPAPVPPPPTPLMTSIDPRIQHQMNLMAMMFQHQQGAGIPPPHISPIPSGLMYPGQYFTPQHNYLQGGLAGAVSVQPPMPREVVVPAPLDAEDGKNTAETADSTGLTPRLGPVAVEMPPPVPRDKSLKVSFSHLQIRTYETILGDNPSCTGGPSLSIGWRYNPEHFESTVDEYELKQDELYGGPGIRPLDIDLVLHRSERESILLKLGYTQSDLAEAVRRLNKAKSKRRQTVHNLPVMFLEEKVESCKRSLGRLFTTRQRTRHMYDDWKKKEKVAPK